MDLAGGRGVHGAIVCRLLQVRDLPPMLAMPLIACIGICQSLDRPAIVQ